MTRTDPGPDEAAPEVTIDYPQDGTQLQVNEAVTSINIEFEVSDDIEIETISLAIDGTEIASFSEFKDFRRYVGEYLYDNVTNGAHELTITATDVDGKSGSKTVSFEKLPPYTPLYDGEIFYMPFNGDYMELVSVTNATEVGSPGFAGEGVQGGNAYAGASGAYLTFPAAALTNEEVGEIAELNILGATLLAMRRAVQGLARRPEVVLVDGNCMPPIADCCDRVETLVKGDALVRAISARVRSCL